MRQTSARGTRMLGLTLLLALVWAVPSTAADSALARVDVKLHQPEVPKVGRNRFKVVVEDGYGQPLQDAEVSLTLYRRGVPGSKGYIQHPVQTKVRLTPGEVAGVYEADGPIVASGLWDVKMQVKPRGAKTKKITRTTKIWADD
jgi:hypothetical protein